MKRSDTNQPKNIQATKNRVEAATASNEVTPTQRLRLFVNWAKSNGLCKSEYDFERQCNLSPKYITNNMHSTKGNIGTEMLGRIIRVFPQINLGWLCTGEGQMIQTQGSTNVDYKQAYEVALLHINVLNELLQNRDQ